jgi:biopolymer transport protein TolQ
MSYPNRNLTRTILTAVVLLGCLIAVMPLELWAQPSILTEDLVKDTPRVETSHHSLSSWDLIRAAGPIVKLVLLILAAMSVATWGIIISKTLQLRKAKRQTAKFSEVFWGSRVLSQITEAASELRFSPVASVYAAGQKELAQVMKSNEARSVADPGEDIDTIERALRRAKAEEVTRLEHGTTFLATTASAAPFIGLFGTVWGIMNAFIGLSQVKTSSIQAVAPGISEALIATAIGLAAAIPAAIGFNYFMQQVRVLSRSMDMFSAEFLNIARRHFLK